MNRIITCISIESKKIFKSKLPLLSLFVLTLVPLTGGFFIFVLKDPVLAERLGIISTKAQIVGTADWPSYLNLLAQAMSIGGLIVFGFNISWIFGREYSDRTIRDLLALPISRNIIVFSKFIVAFLWGVILSIYVFVLGLLLGLLVDIPGWSFDVIRQGTLVYIICSMFSLILSTPAAFFASYGRGYLSPFGFILVIVILAQVVAIAGYGEYFPWAVPALISGLPGSDHTMVEDFSIIIVILTSGIGLVSTMLWWRYADQN